MIIVQYRLVIADDHPLFRARLREAVAGLLEPWTSRRPGTFERCGRAARGAAATSISAARSGDAGVRVFRLMYIRAQYPSVPVIVVSAMTIRPPSPLYGIRRSGFIPKTLSVEAMRAAISGILSGGVWTPADVDLNAGRMPNPPR